MKNLVNKIAISDLGFLLTGMVVVPLATYLALGIIQGIYQVHGPFALFPIYLFIALYVSDLEIFKKEG